MSGRTSRDGYGVTGPARGVPGTPNSIDVLGLHAPVVLGTSFGGFVVQRYLARHPEQPAGAVLVSTGPRAASQAETVERFRDLGGDDAAAAMALSFAEATERAQQGRAQHCAPLMAVRPTTAEVDRVVQARISTPEVNRHFTPLIHEMDLRPGLAAARCPVLVLVGEQDPLVPPSNAEEAVLGVPGGLATLHRIAGAGHQLLWDAPDVVENLLRPSSTAAPCAPRSGPEICRSARRRSAPGRRSVGEVRVASAAPRLGCELARRVSGVDGRAGLDEDHLRAVRRHRLVLRSPRHDVQLPGSQRDLAVVQAES